MTGTSFYGSNDPTDSVEAMKEDMVLRIRLIYHQVHATVLRNMTYAAWKKHTNTHKHK